MKKSAFTIAEVLVTLGIIGVVAAMTLPMLAENYQRIVVETRLKKFYTTFNQAILRSVDVNGPYDGWGYFRVENASTSTVTKEDLDYRFNLYLAKFLNITQIREVVYTSGKSVYLYYLADGSAFTFTHYSNHEMYYYPKDPVKCLKTSSVKRIGVCEFVFAFNPVSTHPYWLHHKNKGLEPWKYSWNGKVESLYNDTTRGCNQFDSAPYLCTALIQYNNWQFPKDYPRKIRY